MITRDHIIVIARIIFGAVYFVFGLNYFVHIINLHGSYGLPEDALLEPMSRNGELLINSLIETGYLFQLNKVVQIIGGLLLIVKRFVPIALIILAPITLNIFLFNTLLNPSGFVAGIALLATNLYLAYIYRDSYKSLFTS